MKKRITIILFLLFTIAGYAHGEAAPEGGTYTVERVIDGDTLKLTNGEEVQLIGIQAPEDEKMGQEATEAVNTYYLLNSKEVRLEFDVQERDKYERLLAYVYILVCKGCEVEAWGNVKHYTFDGDVYTFLNARLIQDGYAQPMTIPPNVKYADLFEELYKEARENKRGLWGDLSSDKPRLTSAEAIVIALNYWEVDGKSLNRKTEREAKYDKETGMWRVSFDSVISKPGSRFFIIVNDELGNVDKVIHGR